MYAHVMSTVTIEQWSNASQKGPDCDAAPPRWRGRQFKRHYSLAGCSGRVTIKPKEVSGVTEEPFRPKLKARGKRSDTNAPRRMSSVTGTRRRTCGNGRRRNRKARGKEKDKGRCLVSERIRWWTSGRKNVSDLLSLPHSPPCFPECESHVILKCKRLCGTWLSVTRTLRSWKLIITRYLFPMSLRPSFHFTCRHYIEGEAEKGERWWSSKGRWIEEEEIFQE